MISKTNAALLAAVDKGYYIKDGKAYSKKKELSLSISRSGYKYFCIRFSDERYTVSVHKLVAYQKFGCSMFGPGVQVRHLDGNSLNNMDDNISIGTSVENASDKLDSVKLKAALIATSFVKVHDHVNIQKDRKSGMTYTQIMSKYNISSKGTVSFIINKSYDLNS